MLAAPATLSIGLRSRRVLCDRVSIRTHRQRPVGTNCPKYYRRNRRKMHRDRDSDRDQSRCRSSERLSESFLQKALMRKQFEEDNLPSAANNSNSQAFAGNRHKKSQNSKNGKQPDHQQSSHSSRIANEKVLAQPQASSSRKIKPDATVDDQ